jgi:hypothetical protein
MFKRMYYLKTLALFKAVTEINLSYNLKIKVTVFWSEVMMLNKTKSTIMEIMLLIYPDLHDLIY